MALGYRSPGVMTSRAFRVGGAPDPEAAYRAQSLADQQNTARTQRGQLAKQQMAQMDARKKGQTPGTGTGAGAGAPGTFGPGGDFSGGFGGGSSPVGFSSGYSAALASGPSGGGNFGASLNNSATRDPDIDAFASKYQARLGKLEARENEPVTQSTQRAIDLASSNIADQALGAKYLADNAAVMSGSGRHGAALEGSRIDEATRRLQAGEAAKISLQRERDQDSLNLAREGNVNQLLAGGQNLAGAQANLALQRQGLGVQQWEAQARLALQRRQQEQAEQEANLNRWLALAGGGF